MPEEPTPTEPAKAPVAATATTTMTTTAPVATTTMTPAPDNPHDKARGALAVIIVIGVFAFIGMATFYKAVDPQIALVAIGYVSGWASAVTGFYFGSSASSDAKTGTITKLATNGNGKPEIKP